MIVRTCVITIGCMLVTFIGVSGVIRVVLIIILVMFIVVLIVTVVILVVNIIGMMVVIISVVSRCLIFVRVLFVLSLF